VAGIRAVLSPVLAELSKTARAREGTRDYPFKLVRELANARLLLVGIPAKDGGVGRTDAVDGGKAQPSVADRS
jgi:alkylation response protein AidB-like acyl-CoA dehydrogenase